MYLAWWFLVLIEGLLEQVGVRSSCSSVTMLCFAESTLCFVLHMEQACYKVVCGVSGPQSACFRGFVRGSLTTVMNVVTRSPIWASWHCTTSSAKLEMFHQAGHVRVHSTAGCAEMKRVYTRLWDGFGACECQLQHTRLCHICTTTGVKAYAGIHWCLCTTVSLFAW